MFDFGLSASHILVIAVLAVIAIGPKDLPMVLRRFGQFMNRMRGMARDFQGQVDTAMKDAGMDGIRHDLQGLKSGMTAAMSPASTLMTGAVGSLKATPASSSVTGSTSAASSSMAATLAQGPNDFVRYFGTGSGGETRVQGREINGERKS